VGYGAIVIRPKAFIQARIAAAHNNMLEPSCRSTIDMLRYGRSNFRKGTTQGRSGDQAFKVMIRRMSGKNAWSNDCRGVVRAWSEKGKLCMNY
jgi:hypothetical protein